MASDARKSASLMRSWRCEPDASAMAGNGLVGVALKGAIVMTHGSIARTETESKHWRTEFLVHHDASSPLR